MGHQEPRDCVVRALQFSCSLDYAEAHALAKQWGRKDRRAFLTTQIRALFKHLGLRMRPDLSCRRVWSALSDMQHGRFIVNTCDHTLAVIDGICYDSEFTRWNKIVEMAYEIPVDEPDFLDRFPELKRIYKIKNTHLPVIPGLPHYD